MKSRFLILLVTWVSFSYCQTPIVDKNIIENYTSVSILDAPFLIDEIVEIYKKDTLCIKKAFDRSFIIGLNIHYIVIMLVQIIFTTVF